MIIKTNKNKGVNFIRYKQKPTKNLSFTCKPSPKINKWAMDPQQSNPVYNQLTQQRNNRHVLQFILAAGIQTSPRIKQNNYLLKQGKRKSFSPNFKAFARHHRSCSSRQLERFRKQGETIYHLADEMTVDLKHKKRKIGILQEYNKVVENYCDNLPKTHESNEMELLHAHRQIQRLCSEDALPKEENTTKHASLLVEYEEPKINYRTFKKKMKIVKTQASTIGQTQSFAVVKRYNTQH